jgi:peptidoglycan/xylan/chitin deacetylase (PgdA/CDA1 family)
MKGKRQRICMLLDQVGALELLLRMRRRSTSWLTVLTYHRVARPDGHRFDSDVIDVSPEAFDRQLELISRYFNVVTTKEVRDYFRGVPLPKSPALITFDDGYRDNYEVALPLLRKRGLPATFFIASSFIEERKLFWWDRIAYVVKSSKKRRLALTYPDPIEVDLEDRDEAQTRLLMLVKSHRGLDLPRLLEELDRSGGVHLSRDEERKMADRELMTWTEVRALRQAGMDVQSHTRHHRVLQTLEPKEIDEELRGGRADLEAALDAEVRAVSYPVGRPIADRPEIRRSIELAGFELGFSSATGVSPLIRTLDPFDIRRLGMDYSLSEPLFRGMLAWPQLLATRPG